MLSEGINNRYKASNRPYYVETAQLWKVDIPGWGIEEGDLLYVASEYARAGLIFPYSPAQASKASFRSCRSVLCMCLSRP